ncbi:MAG: L-threonylcarbamoyladenylate synthase [Candidatus Uhrbacteria bacterium]|nr:L-threonylcarbamoyladenylate synthase [Candidatus Uhrbacteria bacterium]
MLSIQVDQIERALKTLEEGGVIVFPTETSYGLGCDATDVNAVKRIFSIKGRPESKGLPVLIPSGARAGEFIEFSGAVADLAQKYWPGALNIIASIAKDSPIALECSNNGTQSVRASSHPFAATLVRRFGKPIVATSANVSGAGEAYSVRDVKANFIDSAEKPDLFIDGGDLPVQAPSTTVKVIGDQVEVIRQGRVIV